MNNSMKLEKDKQLIFVHSPKTAGTTTRVVLRNKLGRPNWEERDRPKNNFEVHEHAGHYTISQYVDWYTEQKGEFLKEDSFEHFLLDGDLFDELPTPTLFEQFVHEGECLIDDFISFENLESDFSKVAKKLNINNYKLEHHDHRTLRVDKSYQSMYTQEMRDFIESLFHWEIEKFNYTFGD